MSDRTPFLSLTMTPFIRLSMVCATLLTLGIGSCISREIHKERYAVKRYQELERRLVGVLRVGTAKDQVMEALRSSGLEVKDWERPEVEPEGIPPDVSVLIAQWPSFPFDRSFYMGLTFRRGHLAGWGPWWS